MTARGRIDPPDLGVEPRNGTLDDALTGERRVGFADRRLETPVYRRDRLPVGADLDGPAVVEGPESTTLLWPGQRADVDRFGSLVVEVG